MTRDWSSKQWLHPPGETWDDGLVVVGVLLMVAALAVI